MTPKTRGIAFNLVSRQKLDSFNTDEKLHYIIDEVKGGRILSS